LEEIIPCWKDFLLKVHFSAPKMASLSHRNSVGGVERKGIRQLPLVVVRDCKWNEIYQYSTLESRFVSDISSSASSTVAPVREHGNGNSQAIHQLLEPGAEQWTSKRQLLCCPHQYCPGREESRMALLFLAQLVTVHSPCGYDSTVKHAPGGVRASRKPWTTGLLRLFLLLGFSW